MLADFLGFGLSTVLMAQSLPNSSFTGFDLCWAVPMLPRRIGLTNFSFIQVTKLGAIEFTPKFIQRKFRLSVLGNREYHVVIQ